MIRPLPDDAEVLPGPALLSGIEDGPSLPAHRRRYGDLPRVTAPEVVAACEEANLRGRGGAAFPFARKLAAVMSGRGRPVVVVNAAEGEPASSKDTVLVRHAPHLVLDGAMILAGALGAREVHVITPRERPSVGVAVRAALAERSDRPRVRVHETTTGFVAGQARAVLELMAGRPGRPVTAWQPEAMSGHRGRPTLLSNAETWAQVARLLLLGSDRYREHGTAAEPGTTLLTVDGRRVVEVAYGTRLSGVLGPDPGPTLLGGFHGAWLTDQALHEARVEVDALRASGTPLGAGVLLPDHGCPVATTARIAAYLAGESAGRCGPCVNGLPALASALGRLAAGGPGAAEAHERVLHLCGLLPGRGACAHPDGTARMTRSLLTAYADEVAAHAAGRCDARRWAA